MTMDNDSKDPELAALFAEAEEPLQDDDFTAAVSARLSPRLSQAFRVKVVGILVVAALGWLLSTPAVMLTAGLMDVLTTPFVDLEPGLAGSAFAPFNSLSAIVGGIFLMVHRFWRKLHA